MNDVSNRKTVCGRPDDKTVVHCCIASLMSSPAYVQYVGSVMEVHHPVFYASLGHMQNNMRSSVTLKLKLALTLTLTITDTGGAVLTPMLGYRPGGELP